MDTEIFALDAENIDKALILSDFVFEDELDKKNFMKQYIKIPYNFMNK